MRKNAQQGLRVLRGILEFLGKTIKGPADLGPIASHINALTAVADRISALMEEQNARRRASSGASTEAQRLSRRLLRSYVRPMARMGKLLFPHDATLRTELKVPKAPISYQNLITNALAIATRVEPQKAKFVEAGFDEDFVEKTRAICAELERALAQKADHVSSRSTATAALVEEYRRAREMVRLINDMVYPLLEGTSHLSGWKSASRFARTTPVEETVKGEDGGAVPAPSAEEVKPVTTTPEGKAA